MKHDEEMNFNCGNCNARISSRNKGWHGGMGDGRFNKGYFRKE